VVPLKAMYSLALSLIYTKVDATPVVAAKVNLAQKLMVKP